VPALRAATTAEIDAAMDAGADPQVRQRLFDRWVAELAIPLAPTVEGLRLGSVAESGGTQLLVLEGTLIEVRTTPPVSPGFPPRRLRIPLDHIAFLDVEGNPVTPALPLPFEHDETVDLDILTNSVEDRALLIPAAPLSPDTYTFTWTIERKRYRSPVVDDTTHYRATVTTIVPIMSTGG
jgi:hypothetical protein